MSGEATSAAAIHIAETSKYSAEGQLMVQKGLVCFCNDAQVCRACCSIFRLVVVVLGEELEAPRCPRRVLILYLHDKVDLLHNALACCDRPSLYVICLLSHTHRAEAATVCGCPWASHGRN